ACSGSRGTAGPRSPSPPWPYLRGGGRRATPPPARPDRTPRRRGRCGSRGPARDRGVDLADDDRRLLPPAEDVQPPGDLLHERVELVTGELRAIDGDAELLTVGARRGPGHGLPQVGGNHGDDRIHRLLGLRQRHLAWREAGMVARVRARVVRARSRG